MFIFLLLTCVYYLVLPRYNWLYARATYVFECGAADGSCISR